MCKDTLFNVYFQFYSNLAKKYFTLTLFIYRYPAHIEEIDYEEGKVLIHFKRWNHRYDEWFCWDSPYLRPLEKIQLRKEGLHEEEGSSVSKNIDLVTELHVHINYII